MNTPKISFDNLNGISACTLGDLIEIALIGTDTSFTLRPRRLDELTQGCYFWLITAGHANTLVEWMGSSQQFVDDTREMIAVWRNNNERAIPIIMPFQVLERGNNFLRAAPLFSPEMENWIFKEEGKRLIIRTQSKR